MSDHIS